MGLCDGLNDQNKKNAVVADCVKLIDEQVSAAKGLVGIGLKAGYAALKGIKPNYYPDAIERLLPEFLTALDPMWNEGVQTGDPVEYLSQNRSRTADALLSVTDVRAENAKNAVVRGTYSKLRNSAKSQVEDAIPGLAKIIDNYTKS